MTLPRGFSRSEDAVVTVSGAAELLYGGLGALNIGTMCTTTDTPIFFPNGIPTNADGLVCITTSPVPPTYASGGLMFDSTNRLIVGLVAAVPSFATAGFLFDANGALVVSGAAPAPVAWLTITGTATENQTLTANLGGGAPVVTAYQWLRGYTPISGATSATYVLGGADIGSVIRVRATHAGGEGFSLPTAVVLAAGRVLLEDSFHLLLEDGSFVLVESGATNAEISALPDGGELTAGDVMIVNRAGSNRRVAYA